MKGKTDEKAQKRGRGRPPTAGGAKKSQLNVRIGEELRQALGAYKEKYEAEHSWQELSDAVRHVLTRAMKAEGLLK